MSERRKPIQPLERSLRKRVLVKDGDRGVAGQPLVELDPTAADSTCADEQLKTDHHQRLGFRGDGLAGSWLAAR